MSIEKTDRRFSPNTTAVNVIWENVHNSAKRYYITNWFNVTKPLWREAEYLKI